MSSAVAEGDAVAGREIIGRIVAAGASMASSIKQSVSLTAQQQQQGPGPHHTLAHSKAGCM